MSAAATHLAWLKGLSRTSGGRPTHPGEPHGFEFSPRVATGWDVHIGVPGAPDCSQGAHVEPDADGLLHYRACTENTYFDGAAAIDAHGGARLAYPFHLNPAAPLVDVALVAPDGTREHVLTFEHGALHDADAATDVLGNRIEREPGLHAAHVGVRLTAPSGRWVRLLCEAGHIVGVRLPATAASG